MMLLWLLLSTVPLEMPLVDRIEVLEHNALYDDNGRHVFDQAIVYGWNRATSRYDVRCWWLIKCEADEPRRDMLRFDGQVMRLVKAERVFRTWSQYDPELAARQVVGVEQRRGLVNFFKDR